MANEVNKINVVNPELLQELKQILREDFNADTPIEEVAEVADRLIKYFELLLTINAKKGGEQNETRK